jgi:hypothetical protein
MTTERLTLTSMRLLIEHHAASRRMREEPNEFLKTAADPSEHESTCPESQGRRRCNRRISFGRRRGCRLLGAEAGRLRLLHQ